MTWLRIAGLLGFMAILTTTGLVRADANKPDPTQKQLAKTPALTPAKDKKEAVSLKIEHLEAARNGWQVAETANFRIFHKQPKEKAEEVARVAESARADIQKRWFGDKLIKDAILKCEIYVHANSADYRKETKVPDYVAGHFSYSTQDGRVVTNCINIALDSIDKMKSIVMHETTHVILYENFGKAMPRWANEGMAVLAEPRNSINGMLRYLPKDKDELFGVQFLMEMHDYPRAADLPIFYAQSVSIVDFMVKEKGPTTFVDFLKDARKQGYSKAVQQHYGCDFPELEKRWLKHTGKYK
ncbi:MAG: peptidase MA family metallohydrolase [Gemmataceae bacterium]